VTSTEPGSTTAAVVDVVDDVAGEFAERIVEAFHYRRGEYFHLGLTGGSTAEACYARLAAHAETQVDWWLVDLWWVDEITSDPGSGHYPMAKRALLSQVGAAYALHPLPTHDLPERLDLVHLDLAQDGTLSWVDAPGRAVLDPAALARTDAVLMTASGAACRDALAPYLADPARLAGRFAPTARVLILADRAAAGRGG
jgi:6-phosphogluconolactonase/glucosamine-6-phosphate isomerase/deaminase